MLLRNSIKFLIYHLNIYRSCFSGLIFHIININYSSTNIRGTMGKPMTKGDIVGALAEKMSATKRASSDFLDALVELAYTEAKNDFTIPGLGKITVVERQKRKGRNPSTGKEITIPAKKVVKFKVSKKLQDAVFPPKKK